MRLPRKEFERIVISALKWLPGSLKNRMENIDVVIQEMGYYFDLDEESPRHWAAQPMSSSSRRASVGIPDSSHPISR